MVRPNIEGWGGIEKGRVLGRNRNANFVGAQINLPA